MMRIVGRWWDGSWATLWRRDVWLRTDGTNWRVEAREGTKGEPWSRDFGPDETGARALVDEMLRRVEESHPGTTWVDQSETYRGR